MAGALTRILNNQIYNGTIIASQKIAAGTITGSLFSSNVTVPGDLLISGNLFVLGTSAYTTIASTNTYVNDPLIVMNNGFGGTNTYDEGLIFNRGSLLNQAFVWSEFGKEFRLIGTPETGTTYGNVSITNFANLHLGNLTVDYNISTAGNFLTTGFINTSGNISAAVYTGGQVSVTGLINTTGNVVASQGSFGTINATGLINTLGNVSASNLNTATLTATGLINTTGNISTAQLNAGQINTTGNVIASAIIGASLNVSGNVNASTVLASLLTGSTATFGNISAVTIGNTGAYLNGGTLNITGNVIGGLAQFAAVNATPIGNATPSTGVFTAVTAGQVSSGFVGNTGTAFTGASLNVTGNVVTATVLAQLATASTATFGNVAAGFIGNTGTAFTGASLNVSGNVSASQGSFGTINATGYINTTGNVSASQITASIMNPANLLVRGATDGSGTVNVSGSINASSYINAAGNVLGTAGIFNSLTVNGNELVTGYLNVTGNILGSAGTLNTLALNSTANATETTGSSGALQIKGGGSIAKDLWIGGNLYVSNIFSTTYSVLTVNDPLLYLTAANTFPYNYAIGFYSQFTGGASNIYQHSGVVRDHVDGYWKTFSNVVAEPSSTISFNADTKYDGIKAGNLILTDSTTSTTIGTGALVVSGGAGIAGTVTAGAFNTAGNVNASTVLASLLTGSTATFGNVAAGVIGNIGTQFTGASINLSGNVVAATVLAQLTTASTATFGNVAAGVIGNIGTQFTGASINLSGNIISTGAVHNSLTVNGNETVTGYLNVTGNVLATRMDATTFAATGTIWANASTASTNTSTGAVVVTGGIGIGGNIFQGGAYHDTSTTNAVLFGTPTTVDAFKAATTLNIGATSGTATIQNPTVIGTQATQNLYNTVATAINFGGTANVTMGAPSGVTVIAGGANVRSVTDSTSFTTGALVVAGGVGIGANLNVKGGNYLTLGKDIASGVVYPENTVQITTTANSSSRISIQNKNNGSLSTTEFQAIADTGSNSSSSTLVGITGSNYAQPGVNIIKPLDSYVLGSGGNIVITSASADTILATGVANVGVRISAVNTNVGVQYTTVSTSATTGAFTVAGGVGLGANLYVRNGATFNAGQSSEDFVVRGKVTTSLILANSNYGALVFGGSNATPTLGAVAKFNSNDSIQIPVGTSAQRPGTSGNTDVTGMLRFNTTINNLEFYTGTLWQTPSSPYTVITSRQFSGNTAGGFGNIDGTNTAFTLSANATTASTLVSINGVLQIPVLAYGVSGPTLTFTEPPAPGDIVDTRVLTTSVSVSALASGSGLNQFVADDVNGAEIWTGTSTTTKRVLVDPMGNFNLLTGNKVTYAQSAINIPATNTATQIDTWSQTSYTTAKYVIQAKVGSTSVESYEALVLTDGSGNAYVTTYGIINNGTTFGTVTANVVGGNVNVYYSSTIAQANVKAMGTFVV